MSDEQAKWRAATEGQKRIDEAIARYEEKVAAEKEATTVRRIPPPNPPPGGRSSFSFPKGWADPPTA